MNRLFFVLTLMAAFALTAPVLVPFMMESQNVFCLKALFNQHKILIE